jgi:hypothetical protein
VGEIRNDLQHTERTSRITIRRRYEQLERRLFDVQSERTETTTLVSECPAQQCA